MDHDIFVANTNDEIESCFDVFQVLRPHLKKDDFLPQIHRQQAQHYQIVAIRENGTVKSVAGFRIAEFLAWGKVLYIDDLSTLPEARSRGYGGKLLDWIIDHARKNDCNEVHLNTGYGRHAAHRLYLNKGFRFYCHHLSMELKGS